MLMGHQDLNPFRRQTPTRLWLLADSGGRTRIAACVGIPRSALKTVIKRTQKRAVTGPTGIEFITIAPPFQAI
jgi:hypothetical protein